MKNEFELLSGFFLYLYRFLKILKVSALILVVLLILKGYRLSQAGDFGKEEPGAQHAFELSANELAVSEGQPFSSYGGIFSKKDIFFVPYYDRQIDFSKEGAADDDPDHFVSSGLLGGYRLQGLLLDQAPQVIVQESTTGKSRLLNVGDILDGAELIRIEEDKAVFRGGAGLFEMRFEQEK